MSQVREKRSMGPSGLADVRIMKNGVRVLFASGDVYELPVEALHKDTPQGKYNVTLSVNKDKIFLKPIASQYILQFKRIGNRVSKGPGDEGLPASKISRGGPRSSKDGTKHWYQNDEVVFVVEVEIVEGLSTNGIYGGLTTTTNLPYSFARPVNGNITDFADTKRNLERIEQFFRVATGKTLTDIDIEYSDNSSELLVRFEKFLMENRRPFLGNIGEKGFLELQSISPVPVELLPKKKGGKK